MGDFTFKWEHPNATEVYVTGTFDAWSKSEKLEKKGHGFEKTVTLPDASKKIYYKFVVDGQWVTDSTAPQENDHEGNLNNVLTPERITKTPVIMSGVTPTSTTAELAKNAPLEKTGSSDLPGAFPETPASEPASFSVNPIPATEGTGNPIHLAPGEKVPDPSTLTNNTVSSTVQDDPDLKSADLNQTVSVAPIPATGGAGNPIHLAPGEKVPEPSTITGNTIHSNVHTDKESYEKGGVSDVPVLPPVVTPEAERAAKGTGILDLPPISKNLIPESSLPIGESGAGTFDASPTIQSVGPQSTTAALAAAVPLESQKVPEVVKESQKEAGVSPEASSDPEELKEKAAVEKELLGEVKPAAVTSDDTHHEKPVTTTATEAGAAVGAAALALGGAALAYVNSAKDKAVAATGIGAPAADASVPEVVKESIAESGNAPEAAAYSEEVKEKSAVEKELLSKVKPETSTGDAAPKIEAPAAGLSAPVTSKAPDSRDISPTTIPGSHKQPVPAAITGETSTTAAPVTQAPASASKTDSPASPAANSSAAADKKKKRSSFFGKLKAKFSDKDKSK